MSARSLRRNGITTCNSNQLWSVEPAQASGDAVTSSGHSSCRGQTQVAWASWVSGFAPPQEGKSALASQRMTPGQKCSFRCVQSPRQTAVLSCPGYCSSLAADIARSFVMLRNRCNQYHLMVKTLSNCCGQFLSFGEQIEFSLPEGAAFRNVEQDFWVEKWSPINDTGPNCLAFAQLQTATAVTPGLDSGWNSEVLLLKYIYPILWERQQTFSMGTKSKGTSQEAPMLP